MAFPNYMNPYGPQFPQLQNTQPPINGLTQVVGIEGARAYQIPPNSTVPLFDANNDIFYVKSTDASNFPTIRTFTFQEVKERNPSNSENYATKDDLSVIQRSMGDLNSKFDKIWEALNGEQSVSEAQSTAN